MQIDQLAKVVVLAVSLAACGDDGSPSVDAPKAVDAAVADGTPDAAPPDPAIRGKYLVDHVAVCSDCHTPRNQDGSPDLTRYMAGAECFIDADPATAGVGCLHSRNLTNHATGLMNRSSAEIKDMFQNGVRPNGTFLVSVMPYYVYHNMTNEDADAVVAYLRTIPGVDHTVPANEAPFNNVPAAAAPLLEADIPMPSTVNAQTTNGRYLATKAGLCLECHTPHNQPGSAKVLDVTKLFAGGEVFPIGGPFGNVVSRNLTPHATGLGGTWTSQHIVTELKTGVDKNGVGICPPMPVGPMGAYGGLTDSDAADIAAYILELPPVDNAIATNCSPP